MTPPDPAGHSPPNCMRCRHFFVTWDPRAPRGCRALGFKTPLMPSAVVRQSSGRECLLFAPREPPAGGGGGGDQEGRWG